MEDSSGGAMSVQHVQMACATEPGRWGRQRAGRNAGNPPGDPGPHILGCWAQGSCETCLPSPYSWPVLQSSLTKNETSASSRRRSLDWWVGQNQANLYFCQGQRQSNG
jgi:hypothetical protein